MSYVSPVVYGVTIPLAFVSPYLCLAVYAALAIFFARGPSARALIAMQVESEAPDLADDNTESADQPALADEGGPRRAPPESVDRQRSRTFLVAAVSMPSPGVPTRTKARCRAGPRRDR